MSSGIANSNESNSKNQTRIDLQKLETYRLTLKKFDITLRLNSESQSPLKPQVCLGHWVLGFEIYL
jgi:hypothetical protein